MPNVEPPTPDWVPSPIIKRSEETLPPRVCDGCQEALAKTESIWSRLVELKKRFVDFVVYPGCQLNLSSYRTPGACPWLWTVTAHPHAGTMSNVCFHSRHPR